MDVRSQNIEIPDILSQSLKKKYWIQITPNTQLINFKLGQGPLLAKNKNHGIHLVDIINTNKIKP